MRSIIHARRGVRGQRGGGRVVADRVVGIGREGSHVFPPVRKAYGKAIHDRNRLTRAVEQRVQIADIRSGAGEVFHRSRSGVDQHGRSG
ncbi:MAG: hypothetical protein ACREVV_08305 [Steroidobacteraceae bacterium]